MHGRGRRLAAGITFLMLALACLPLRAENNQPLLTRYTMTVYGCRVVDEVKNTYGKLFWRALHPETAKGLIVFCRIAPSLDRLLSKDFFLHVSVNGNQMEYWG